MGNLGNGLDIWDVISWVSNALDIDCLGLVVNSGSDVLGVLAVDELGVDAQAREEDLELVVGAAIQVRGGDDVVTGLGQSRNCDELGSLA